MTTKEIAEKLGVSRVTVSKVINNKTGVSGETRKMIEEYMEKNNYAPSSSARNLAGKESNIIGLFSKYSSVSQNDEDITSHFSSEFTSYVINEAQLKGYKVLVSIVSDEKNYGEIGKCFNSGLISGAILIGYEHGNRKIKELVKNKHKLILVNQEEKMNGENVALINMDDEEGAYSAIENLIKDGRKKILYIGSKVKRLPSLRRMRGASKCYEENRDKIESFYIENGDFTKESGYRIVKKILENSKEYPTGIFAANDFMALGAVKAIKEFGYKIPEDISVIGFDDITVSKYTSPSLTTVKCDFKEMAEMATDTLIEIIKNKKFKKIQECTVNLVRRESAK